MLIIINSSIYLSIHPSIHLSIYPSIHIFLGLIHSFIPQRVTPFLGALRIQKLISPSTSLDDVIVFKKKKTVTCSILGLIRWYICWEPSPSSQLLHDCIVPQCMQSVSMHCSHPSHTNTTFTKARQSCRGYFLVIYSVRGWYCNLMRLVVRSLSGERNRPLQWGKGKNHPPVYSSIHPLLFF